MIFKYFLKWIDTTIYKGKTVCICRQTRAKGLPLSVLKPMQVIQGAK